MASISGGSVVWQLDIDDSKFKSKIRSASNDIRSSADSTQKSTSKSWSKMGATMGAVAGVAQAAFVKAMQVISNAVDSAVRRVDVLNNFPKIMSNMNISAQDSKKVINELSDSLIGLPTSLDSAALAVQRLTASTGDVNRAKDVFLALNNAILAGGAPMDLQSTALEQFSQAFAKGKPDMIEWRALMSAMPAQLKQLAEELNQPNMDALGAALREGELSMTDFSNALVKLNKEGTGNFQSFEKQAKNSTNGIQTGIANMNTAISRGLANILDAIGQTNISSFLKGIGTAFERVTKVITNFIKENPELAKTIGLVAGATLGLTILIGGLVLAFNLLWSPVTLIAFVLASLVALFIKFKDQVMSVVNIFKLIATGDFQGGIFGLQEDSPVIGFFLKLHDILSIVWGFLKGAFLTVWESLKDIFVNAVLPALKDLWQVIKENATVFKVLGIIIGTVLLAPLALLVGAIIVGAKVFKALAPIIKVVIRIIGVLLGVIIKLANFLIKSVVVGIKIVIGAFKLWVAGWKLLGRIAENVAGFLITAFTLIKDTVVGVFTDIWNFIRPILNFFLNLFIIVWGTILLVTIEIWAKIIGFIKAVVMGIYNFVAPIFVSIFNFFVSIFTSIFNFVVSIMTGIFNFFRTIFTGIYNFFKSILTAIFNFFAPAVSWLYERGKAIIQGLVNGIRSLASSVWGAIKYVADRIGAFFSGAWNWLYDTGKAIIQGLINGIKNMAGAVGRAVSDTANTVKNKFKSILGIRSPSKVFAGFGENIGEGLAQGVDKSVGIVDRAISGLSGTTISGVGISAPNVAGSGLQTGNTSNQTVSINSVVLNSAEATKEFFNELNQDSINLGMGLTPIQGA